MPWRGHNGHFCHACGKHRNEVGPLSARYLCAACGDQRHLDNSEQLRNFRGPHYERWRTRLAATLAVLPVDAAPPEA